MVGGEENGWSNGWSSLMLSIHAAGCLLGLKRPHCAGELRLAPEDLWGEGRGDLCFGWGASG